jgi:hypothetical protein
VVSKLLLALALVCGALITYVDSRPGWDDTGIMALAILIVCGSLGCLRPQRPWVWALAVGLWIPLLGIVRTHNYGSVLALLIAFAGAYGGMAIRNVVAPARTRT